VAAEALYPKQLMQYRKTNDPQDGDLDNTLRTLPSSA